jgi:hypothetical protein
MFTEKKDNKSAFFLQMKLKAEIKLNPVSFRRKVNSECEKNETLRFAYAYRGLSQPYCVCLKERMAELSFEDLSSVSDDEIDNYIDMFAQADIRRGFDLEKDSLLRIHIFKLEKKDNYAIIMSQPHINSDGTSIGILIKDLFIDYVLNVDAPQAAPDVSKYKSIAEYRQNIDINKELDYWKDYLQDLTEDVSLPGRIESDKTFEETVYIKHIPDKLRDALLGAPKRYKTTTYNTMQAAWGVMLSRITGRQDIVFGAIISGREMGMFNSLSMPGGFVKVIPVRIKLSDDMTFGEVVTKSQKEFARSMAYSHVSIDQMKEAIGRKTELFNHILNCHNFAGNQAFNKESNLLPGFKIVDANVYDNLSEDLAIYIRQEGEDMQLGIGYNKSALTDETVQLYAETFISVLEEIMFNEEDVLIGNLKTYSKDEFEFTANLRQVDTLKKTMLLSKNVMFRQVDWDALMTVAEKSYFKTYMPGDIIMRENERLDEVFIIISGVVMMKSTSTSGWKNPVAVLKDGAVISLVSLLEDKVSFTQASVREKEALILGIPAQTMKDIMARYPSISLEIISMLFTECYKYEKLWIEV